MRTSLTQSVKRNIKKVIHFFGSKNKLFNKMND
jgi:hypothetical protein